MPAGAAPAAERQLRVGADEGAVADPTRREAFRREPLVCDGDRVAGNVQPSSQFPSRRQTLPFPKPAIHHGFDELTVNPGRQIAPSFQADVDVHPANLNGLMRIVNIGSCDRPIRFL